MDKNAPRFSKKKRVAAANGMLLSRAELFDDGMNMPIERKGPDIILRVRVKGINAEGWQRTKECFENGRSPYLLLDRSGLVVKMRDVILSGQPISRRSPDKILEALPKGTELPGGLRWTDFTDRQLVALVLLSDVMSSNSRATIASIAGVEQETLDAWEGNEKFLKVKKWLLERSSHKMREQFMKNVAQGMDSESEPMRVAWTKMAGERLGYLGRKDKASRAPGASDPALIADIQAEIGDMSEAEKKTWAERLTFAAAQLTGAGVVSATASGKLVAKAKEQT